MHSDKQTAELIRKNLVNAIRSSGLTQTEIAARAGLGTSAISNYIHRGKLPTLCTFVVLCEVLDVSSEDILEI